MWRQNLCSPHCIRLTPSTKARGSCSEILYSLQFFFIQGVHHLNIPSPHIYKRHHVPKNNKKANTSKYLTVYLAVLL